MIYFAAAKRHLELGGNVRKAISVLGIFFLVMVGVGTGVSSAYAQDLPSDYQQVRYDAKSGQFLPYLNGESASIGTPEVNCNFWVPSTRLRHKMPSG
jgi:hypothetical protein